MRGRWWTFSGRTYWWDQRGGRWVLLRFTPVQADINRELAAMGGSPFEDRRP